MRFRGTVRPQHDGTRVAIQRKRADGTWATVRTPLLRDAGSAYSRYSKRIRIRRSGTYRTVIARPRGPRRGRQPRADVD